MPADGPTTPAVGHPVPYAGPDAAPAGSADDGYDTAGYEQSDYGRPGYEQSDYGQPGYEHGGYGAGDGQGGARPPREEGPNRSSVLLPLAILVVVVLVAIFAWQLAPRGGGDDTVASGTTSSQSPSSGEASSSPEPTDSGQTTPEESPSAESSGPEKIDMASTAKRCDTVGDTVAYRGNEVTTCDFAVEVAQALADSAPDLPATVTARSPVTKKDYTMECENTSPVTCRGGDNALVYVDRG